MTSPSQADICPDMEACRTLIRRVAPLDYRMYDLYAKRFEARLAALGPGFAERTALLKAAVAQVVQPLWRRVRACVRASLLSNLCILTSFIFTSYTPSLRCSRSGGVRPAASLSVASSPSMRGHSHSAVRPQRGRQAGR